MKNSLFGMVLIVFISSTALAQEYKIVQSPFDFWAGEWVQKTTSISPAPKSDAWKAQVVLNRFEQIMNGDGLYRQAFTDDGVIEAYFFLDSGAGKVYGMSIDANGYVWQTESKLSDEGGISQMVGEPLNDKSLKIESNLKRLNENNVEFTQNIYEDGKKVQTLTGIFIRVPGY